MASREVIESQMVVWCPLIPPDKIQSLLQHKDDLSRINEAYEDWRVSMRGKEFNNVKPGVLLDRIRMLMIKVGVSCAGNRNLAEEVQTIVSNALKERALSLVSELQLETPEKKTLVAFFRNLKFTRDIYPLEEIEKCLVMPASSSGNPESIDSTRKIPVGLKGGPGNAKMEAIEQSLLYCMIVLEKLYVKLVSLDPWGES